MSTPGKKRRAGPPPVIRHQPNKEGRDVQSRPSDIGLGGASYAEIQLRDGPIPDAQELVRYGYAHPDAPEIILTEFTQQGAHRRLMERREICLERMAMQAAVRSERMGVACALGAALVGFGCATYLVSTGHGMEGTVIFGVDVAGLVYAFIRGRTRAYPRGQRQHAFAPRSPSADPLSA
jgi:hypothetical protein